MERPNPIVIVIIGAITIGIGSVGILSVLGYLPHGRSDPSVPVADQQALAVCVSVVFTAGGLSAMLSALPGRASRIAMSLLGFVIVIGLTSLFAWTAIGPGDRAFSSPLAIFSPQVNAISGRILFGLVALMGLAMAILMVRGVGRTKSTDT
jgi:hypothetical protein